jgi:asparagine N-glycosylation enzyme membrane subunit Stt3
LSFLKKYGWLLIIALALLTATILRIILPWNTIFTPNGVIFTGVDCYYYTHLADLISNNGMQVPIHDYYFDYPKGIDYSSLAPSYNGYGVFIALLAWIFSWGHPTKDIIDVVSGLHPAILGILALIPIFVITKKLTKNNWIASLTMLLGSVMPGEYMGRAMLGAADTHCLEIFLFSFAVMFAVLALNDRKVIYIVLSGLLGTCYLLIWQGAVIFPVLLALFAVLWLIWTRVKGKPDYESTGTVAAILAVMLIGYLAMSYQHVSNSLLTLFAPLALVVVFLIYTGLTSKIKNSIYLIPIGIIATVGTGLLIVQWVGYTGFPEWLSSTLSQVINLVMWHTDTTTAEELPILITLGTVTPEVPWVYFSVSWYLVFIGVGMMLYQWRKSDLNISFLLVWTILMIIPTLAMRRFAYYSAINIIIVSGYAIWLIIRYILKDNLPETALNKK